MTDLAQSFRVAASRTWPRDRIKAIALVATAVVFTLLLAYRNHRLFIQPELWAEDIDVYFMQNRLLGLHALFQPHNGFTQFVTRLYAWLIGLADPLYAPRLYAALFLASIFATAAIVYTSPVFTGLAKPLAALALLMAPVNSEVFYAMSYTPWVMGVLVAIVLCETPQTRLRAVVLLVPYALVGLSSPFVMLAIPFVAVRAFVERSKFSYALGLTTLVTALVQFQHVVHRFTGNAARGPALQKFDALASFMYRWMTGAGAVLLPGAAAIAAFTVVFMAWYVWAHRRSHPRPLFYLFGYGCWCCWWPAIRSTAPRTCTSSRPARVTSTFPR